MNGADIPVYPKAGRVNPTNPGNKGNVKLVGGLDHFLFFHVLGIMIPTDFHIFSEGFKPPTRKYGSQLKPGSLVPSRRKCIESSIPLVISSVHGTTKERCTMFRWRHEIKLTACWIDFFHNATNDSLEVVRNC